jgi:HlyD family secretion protein
MTMTAVPTAPPASRSPGRRWWVWVIPLAVAALAAAGYWAWTGWSAARADSAANYKFQPVAPAEMQVKVHKDGELQSVENVEIMSLVEGLSTIVQIVKEGAYVNQGDVLVQLDGSLIRQKIEDTTLDLQRAESDVAAARNVLEIQQTQNEANLEAAKVDVALAKLSVQEYTDGVYPADLATAEVTLRMAKITEANKQDDLKQTRELFGKGFVNLADVKQAELALETTKNDVNKAASGLNVLSKYSHPMMLAGKESYLRQADQKLARTKVENQNNLTKAETALLTTETAKKILDRRMARLKEQLDFCTIKAPSSGLVVYNSTNRSDAAPIQEGTQVRERQVLLRLPDTSAMKAVVRINESQVIRLALNQQAFVAITGMREQVHASLTRISPVSDSSSRWMNPDTREYPVELTLDWTPPNLKPGIGVQVEIMVDNIPNAITVPLSAIYSAGADNFVFVRPAESGSPVPRKVEVGVANETHVRVVNGLKSGEQVVLLQAGQGRDMLEKAGIQPAPNDQPKARKPDGKKADPAGKKAQPPTAISSQKTVKAVEAAGKKARTDASQ